MDMKNLTQQKSIATRLFIISLIIWAGCWAYMAFLFNGDAESNMWAPVAGFFEGFVYGGFFAILPAIYSFFALKGDNKRSLRLAVIFNLSALWIISVFLLYVVGT
ncbi:hypothetical protein [Alteromonas mediterranea]|uniref:hypothetical protein n=1 Tax=Alteromonas mediterranea TaxID=314275 RepID=UPI0015E83A88|nr:hypothetical protein [Alteromonas mediterranea]